jgi:hypothetical protein
MSAMWMASVLGLALAGDPAPPAAQISTEPATSDARPRPFVQVGVGGSMVYPRFYDRWQVSGGPTFAVEAGAAWNPLPRLRLGIGGAMAQTGYARGLASANTDVLAKTRIGLGTSRIWGYAIAGAGLSLVVRDLDYTDLRPGMAALLGLGLRGRVGRRVSLGFDLETTVVGIPPIGQVTRTSGLFVIEARFGS